MQITRKIYNLQSLNFLQNCNLKVGILGGSFNPAHDGHLQISNHALKFLELDYIIWLVSLQNPLKPSYQKDIFTRAIEAMKIVDNPKILIATMEYDIHSNYTYEALKILKQKFNSVDFVWLMGADNIKNFHKWYRYEDIIKLCKILIFNRPGYSRYLNFSSFVMKFKGMIDKNQTSNIMTKDIMVYHGIMSKSASSLIRK
jgi:nicotinate-nucleotide adenylyltransferase